MKNLLLTITLLFTTICIGQTETHTLNIEKSTIYWKGSYMFKMSEHTGDIQFKSGQLISQSGNIIGGSFVVDMPTISNEEYREKGHGPVKHLKNEDFFDVTKYPEARVEITKVAYYDNDNSHRLYANMTIKGVTKPIEVMAYVNDASKNINIKFKIDRTRWGINHNNKLKDHSISDAIEFDVLLQF